MRKTTATVVALAACMSVQLLAQNTKEDTITFALTARGQSSVSQTTSPNAGDWAPLPSGHNPFYYKTTSTKLTQVEIIKSIGAVMKKNYSSSAKLVLVQGELSGFFNITPAMAGSTANRIAVPVAPAFAQVDGTFTDLTGDTDTQVSASKNATFVTLANGRHYVTNPIDSTYPPGHHQPWGQIFVKDTTTKPMTCDNVTFFFTFTVQECYDCFYMNSFVSDATFKMSPGSTVSGPPCCGGSPGAVIGSGKDQYYMTMGFDNTQVNPYLDPTGLGGFYVGLPGIVPPAPMGTLDGTQPDGLPYVNKINSALGKPSPYMMRFVLNGSVSYTWNLNYINKNDLLPEFYGSASYTANGYGFVALTCQILTGTAAFTERLVAQSGCCLNNFPGWFSNWYDSDPLWPAPVANPTPVNSPADLSKHVGAF